MKNIVKKSRLGKLRKKFDESGIMGGPVITDKELETLLELLIEFRDAAEDFGDLPLKYLVNSDVENIQRVVFSRNLYHGISKSTTTN